MSCVPLRRFAPWRPAKGHVTYTCVPPGSGARMGVDRDEDTVLDGLDNCPQDPNTNQANEDGDLLGDACDEDFDPPPPSGC